VDGDISYDIPNVQFDDEGFMIEQGADVCDDEEPLPLEQSPDPQSFKKQMKENQREDLEPPTYDAHSFFGEQANGSPDVMRGLKESQVSDVSLKQSPTQHDDKPVFEDNYSD